MEVSVQLKNNFIKLASIMISIFLSLPRQIERVPIKRSRSSKEMEKIEFD